MPCFGHIALVLQSIHGTGPQISSRRDFADEDVWLVFFQAMVLYFLGYLLELPLWETNASHSCETQPNCGTIFTMATAFLLSLCLLWELAAFLWLFVWLLINLLMREQTLLSGFALRFCFVNLTLGWMPTSARRSRASTLQIISARLSENGTIDNFVIFLFFDTLRPRVIDGLEGVAAVCSGFWARSLLSCRKLHWSPCEHWPFSLIPIRFLTKAPVSILPCLASKFHNRSFWSFFLLSIVFNFW